MHEPRPDGHLVTETGHVPVAALKQVQLERPAYISNDPQSAKRVENWWGEVIRRTAIGAGADSRSKALFLPQRWRTDHRNYIAVDEALDDIVPTLLRRFSSREGYALYNDVIPTRESLATDCHLGILRTE